MSDYTGWDLLRVRLQATDVPYWRYGFLGRLGASRYSVAEHEKGIDTFDVSLWQGFAYYDTVQKQFVYLPRPVNVVVHWVRSFIQKRLTVNPTEYEQLHIEIENLKHSNELLNSQLTESEFRLRLSREALYDLQQEVRKKST